MANKISTLIGFIVVCLWFIGIIIYCFLRKFGKSKSVKATIVHKQSTEVFSKYSGTGKAYKYYVTFQFNGKRKSFAVSELTYNGYRVGEKGTLKYKLGRVIDFH